MTTAPIRQPLLSPHLVRQILRFGVVGGSAFIVDFGLLIFLTEYAGWNYLVSATFSFIVSTMFNYILSIYWVFDRCRERRSLQRLLQILLFVSLATCGLGVNNLIMWGTVEVLGISYVIGKLVATVVVMVFNFVTRKMLLEGQANQDVAVKEVEIKAE